MKYKYLLFDFDGTLVDSSEGIICSLKKVFKEFGIKEIEEGEYRKYIGPPLNKSLHEHAGLSREKAAEGVAFFRGVYNEGDVYKAAVYPGIPELLVKLKQAGYGLYVATSKPEKMALKLLDEFEITGLFDGIAGGSDDEKRSTKKDVIEYLMDRFGISDKKNMLMIGDTVYDIEGAHQVGLDALGILYGFGTRSELTAAGAEYVFDGVKELEEFLL